MTAGVKMDVCITPQKMLKKRGFGASTFPVYILLNHAINVPFWEITELELIFYFWEITELELIFYFWEITEFELIFHFGKLRNWKQILN